MGARGGSSRFRWSVVALVFIALLALDAVYAYRVVPARPRLAAAPPVPMLATPVPSMKAVQPTSMDCAVGSASLNFTIDASMFAQYYDDNNSVMIAIDNSQSMDAPPSKLQDAKMAASIFVSLLNESDEAGLVNFNGTAKLVKSPTKNRFALIAAISGLTPDYGGTALDDALRVSIDELLINASPLNVFSIIMLTDGENSGPGSDPQTLVQAQRAKDNGIKVFTIGLGT
ncbi:MAG: vWA domain-containing protein, partial [Nanoarchaeota archaeon]